MLQLVLPQLDIIDSIVTKVTKELIVTKELGITQLWTQGVIFPYLKVKKLGCVNTNQINSRPLKHCKLVSHLLKNIFLLKILRAKVIFMVQNNIKLQVFYILNGKNSKIWLSTNKSQQQNRDWRK